MALQRVVMHVAALENLAEHMAHLFADAKQADRAAFGSFGLAHVVLSYPKTGAALIRAVGPVAHRAAIGAGRPSFAVSCRTRASFASREFGSAAYSVRARSSTS